MASSSSSSKGGGLTHSVLPEAAKTGSLLRLVPRARRRERLSKAASAAGRTAASVCTRAVFVVSLGGTTTSAAAADVQRPVLRGGMLVASLHRGGVGIGPKAPQSGLVAVAVLRPGGVVDLVGVVQRGLHLPARHFFWRIRCSFVR